MSWDQILVKSTVSVSRRHHVVILHYSKNYYTRVVHFQNLLFHGMKIMPLINMFLTKCNCNNNNIYMDDSHIFYDYETLFPQSPSF